MSATAAAHDDENQRSPRHQSHAVKAFHGIGSSPTQPGQSAGAAGTGRQPASSGFAKLCDGPAHACSPRTPAVVCRSISSEGHCHQQILTLLEQRLCSHHCLSSCKPPPNQHPRESSARVGGESIHTKHMIDTRRSQAPHDTLLNKFAACIRRPDTQYESS